MLHDSRLRSAEQSVRKDLGRSNTSGVRALSFTERGMYSISSKACKIYPLTFGINFTSRRFEKEILQNVANYTLEKHEQLQYIIVNSEKGPKFEKWY